MVFLNLIFSKIFFLSFRVFSPTKFPLKNTTSKTKIKGFAFPVFLKTEGIPFLPFVEYNSQSKRVSFGIF